MKFVRRIIILLLAVSPFAVPYNCTAELLTIGEFRALAPQSGEFEITGYVAKRYECPPCPPQAMCKPCMPENILVSEITEILERYPASGQYVVIFTDSSEKFTLGKRYDFTIQVLTSASNGYGAHDLRLKASKESPKG